MTGYCDHQAIWRQLLGPIVFRNLRFKYRLKSYEAKTCLAKFIEFKNSLPTEFLSKEQYYDDAQILRTVIEKFRPVFDAPLETRLGSPMKLSETETQVASFLLSYWPIKHREATENEWGIGSAIHCSQAPEGKAAYTLIGEVWARNFTNIVGQDLGSEILKARVPARYSFSWPTNSAALNVQEHKLYRIGDHLAGLGLAYWTCWVNSAGSKTKIELKVPHFLAEMLPQFEKHFQQISNISENLKSFDTGSSENLWSLEEILDDDTALGVYEADIEQSLLTHPGLLEPGLTWYNAARPNQFPTGVGRIDLLAIDSRDNLVVIELKKDRAGAEVAGQIQKYMAWVDQNLSDGRAVRGIIVASRAENDLELAISGSRYPIEIRVFGNMPPIEQNLKFCADCGASISKRAKYCTSCGQEQWL